MGERVENNHRYRDVFFWWGFACDEGRAIGTIGNLASVKTKLTKGISS